MSQALRKLTGVTNRTNCIVIFINQLREKIGVSYGNPETTTGGRALKFYASIRIDIRRAEAIKVAEKPIGNRTKIKITKNKVAPPFRTCEVDMMYGLGISRDGDLLDLGIELGLVKKSGSWFNYGEVRLGQGRENAKQFLRDNPDVYSEIEHAARAHYGMKTREDLAAPENSKKVDKTALSADDIALDIELMEDFDDPEEILLEDDM